MWPFKRTKAQVQAQPAAPVAPGVQTEEYLRDPEAKRLAELLSNRDWVGARQIFDTAATPEHFSYYVIKAADADGLQEWIDDPIRHDPDSALPLLCKGARGVYWAWEARGTGMAKTVGEDQWKIWFKRLKDAEDSLDEVLERDPANTEAWHWLIVLARARQVSKEERWRRFEGLAALNPLHLYGNQQMLECLKAKWSGSHEEMFAFARQRAAMAPGTAMPSLIADAHLQMHWSSEGNAYIESKEVGDELVHAAEQSIWHPAYQRTLQTPLLWNTFALTFALADRFAEAKRCFDQIGDEYILERTWGPSYFVKMRNYVNSNL